MLATRFICAPSDQVPSDRRPCGRAKLYPAEKLGRPKMDFPRLRLFPHPPCSSPPSSVINLSTVPEQPSSRDASWTSRRGRAKRRHKKEKRKRTRIRQSNSSGSPGTRQLLKRKWDLGNSLWRPTAHCKQHVPLSGHGARHYYPTLEGVEAL